MIERIEERVRNMVGPFYTMSSLFKDLANEEDTLKRQKLINYVLANNGDISKTMDSCINYLIDMAKILDEHLPDGFDINELLDKEKYQTC